MSDILDNYFGIHAQALSIWSRRAELLASNIANADTPNYKAQDLNFKSVLAQTETDSATGMTKTNAAHINQMSVAGLNLTTQYRVPLQPSLDGNTVDSQIEHSLFSENSVRHQISMHFLSNRISGLIKTLREE